MMRNVFFSLGLIATLCGEEAQAPKPENLFATPQQNVERVMQGSTAFAMELFHEIAPLTTNNLCFSPYSALSALAIPYSGAKGATQFQMQKVLHLQIASGSIEEAIASLNQQLFSKPSDTSEELRILLANSMWVQSGMNILPSFLDTVDKFFRGLVRRVDFAHQQETARSEINNWTRERTFGKIPEIVPKGTINSGTRLVVVNSLYLKAKWENPFDARITTREAFFVDDNTTVSPEMMIGTFSTNYLAGDGFAALELPYTTLRSIPVELALLILLPKQNLTAFEKGLTLEKLNGVISGLRQERVHITLPKFKFTSSLQLKDALIKLGMIEPFSENADFSGITGNRDLMISDVLQKTLIAVDEAGTEAAAASAITMKRTAMIPGNPIDFAADHPFMYILYDKKTGVILFMGRVANPIL